MSKHTPGPWEVEYGSADYLEIIANYWQIAFIELDEHGANPTPEQEANAHLIAAAPQLLEALEKIEYKGRGANKNNKLAIWMGDTARAAIAAIKESNNE